MSVCAQTSLICDGCGQFKTPNVSLCQCPPLQHLVRQIGELRDALGTLEARIADLEGDNGKLRRRITELEHGRNANLEAVNAQAAAIEALEQRT